MKSNKYLYLISFLFLFNAVLAQEPLWKAEKLGPIEWMRVTELGYLVVSTTGSIKCLDPDTGKQLWENKSLGTVREDMFSEVSGTQYLQIAYGLEEGDNDMPMVALVDVVTGALIFDSNKERLGVLGTYPLPQSGKFLVVGSEPGKFHAKLYMYDMQTGAKLWVNEDLFKGSTGKGGLLGKMAAAVEGVINMQSLTSKPVEADGEHIYITHPSYVIKLKASDGATVWRAKIEESTRAQLIYTRNKPDVIYVAAELESESMMSSDNKPPAKIYTSHYYAFQAATGQPVWKAPVRVQNERINLALPGNKGLILLPGASGSNRPSVNQLNYESGAGLWGTKGKGVKIEGTVVDNIFTDDGLVIALERQSNISNRGLEYYLNILNLETGELKFGKSPKVKGRLVRVEKTAKGILYHTTHEVNILDVQTGNLALNPSIESGGPKRGDNVLPFPVSDTGDKLYVFATREGIIKELDKTTGTIKSINTAKIEFGGKELPKSIDAFEDGITLCSDQNIIIVGYDGKVKHSNYFTPPRESGLMRALALAEAIKGAYVGVAMLSASATYADIASSSSDRSTQTLATGASALTGGIALASFSYTGKALQDFNRRFKATTNTSDFLIVLSEVAPKDFRLLQVDKNTGNVKTTFNLGKDRNPVYQADLILNQVYFIPQEFGSGYEIHCFKLD
ncbi:MAG TPA: PQQ-binding-like beta-propeller repeat protein [Cyclobacteriaceae bacterium]|nr:PQQ-binding-like beta-propeller repeat protein [Cyclobacteriaceae bacterium]